MKKSYVLLIVFLLVGVIFAYFKVKTFQVNKNVITKFNLDYEYYNSNNLNGLDITTLINKAVSNNEKYNISKDEDGYYILDDEYSIEIYIKMIINNTTYKMERFNQIGLDSFTSSFALVNFKCTNVTYHEKNGRIATMTFEATEY